MKKEKNKELECVKEYFMAFFCGFIFTLPMTLLGAYLLGNIKIATLLSFAFGILNVYIEDSENSTN